MLVIICVTFVIYSMSMAEGGTERLSAVISWLVRRVIEGLHRAAQKLAAPSAATSSFTGVPSQDHSMENSDADKIMTDAQGAT
jgi:hypothetical protein